MNAKAPRKPRAVFVGNPSPTKLLRYARNLRRKTRLFEISSTIGKGGSEESECLSFAQIRADSCFAARLSAPGAPESARTIAVDCFAILILGLLAFVALTAGLAALALFGLGSIVWGVILLPQRPLAGVVWIIVGLAISAMFARMDQQRMF